jgi:hypothetical protein
VQATTTTPTPFGVTNSTGGVATAATQTTVTLDTSDVALNSVALAAGQSPTLGIAITPGMGAAPRVALSSLMTNNVGNIVAQNGGTCQATAPLGPPVCASGFTLCGTTCVNEATDSSNCGSCGNVCPSPKTCVQSVCTSSVIP